MRDGQIYLARRGDAPHLLTTFAPADRNPADWGPVVWSPDNRYLAVAIGKPTVSRDQDATASGVLYLVDVHTGGAIVVAPASAGQPGIAVGQAAYAWQDAATLLFAAAGRVFTYSTAAGTALPLQGLAGNVVNLEVRGQALFYSSYPTPSGPFFVLPVALRRHDLATNTDSAIADLGSMLFQVTGCNAVGCHAAPGVPNTAPAWDVALDGSRLAFEHLADLAPGGTQATMTFWQQILPVAAAGTPTPSVTPSGVTAAPVRVFADVATGLPLGVPGACCFMRFAPDGRGLVLSSGYAMPKPFGPYLLYTHNLGLGYQVGFPWSFGPAAWAPDAASFTLVNHVRGAADTTLLTYADQKTTTLEGNAYGCAWANARSG